MRHSNCRWKWWNDNREVWKWTSCIATLYQPWAETKVTSLHLLPLDKNSAKLSRIRALPSGLGDIIWSHCAVVIRGWSWLVIYTLTYVPNPVVPRYLTQKCEAKTSCGSGVEHCKSHFTNCYCSHTRELLPIKIRGRNQETAASLMIHKSIIK